MIFLLVGLFLIIGIGGAGIAFYRLGEFLKGNSWDGL